MRFWNHFHEPATAGLHFYSTSAASQAQQYFQDYFCNSPGFTKEVNKIFFFLFLGFGKDLEDIWLSLLSPSQLLRFLTVSIEKGGIPFCGVSAADETLSSCLTWTLCRDLSVWEILFCTDHLAFVSTSHTHAYPDSWAFSFLVRSSSSRIWIRG